MTDPCEIYSATGPTWPVRAFSANYFPRTSAARGADSRKAWNFFEYVENHDANVRIQLSALPTPYRGVNPWYQFPSESERTLYERGRLLHVQLCPDRNWKPQRHLGIPTINVYPPACGEEGARELYVADDASDRGFSVGSVHSSAFTSTRPDTDTDAGSVQSSGLSSTQRDMNTDGGSVHSSMFNDTASVVSSTNITAPE
jgi:hypothetical protein